MTFKQINDRLYASIPPRFCGDKYSYAAQSEIHLVFKNAKTSHFSYSEKIRIFSRINGGLIVVTVEEKNSGKEFFQVKSFFALEGNTDYANFMTKLIRGYCKLGKATIEFYDSI